MNELIRRGRGRPRPDFMVVGAMRAGTTRLHEMLALHPAIHMTDPKEPHHFDADHYAGFTGPGDRWVAEQVVADPGEYALLVEPWPPAEISGESSVTYLYLPGVLDRVAAAVPGVKVVAVLREPVRRAYSSYWYLRSQRREPLSSFEEAIAAEPSRRAAGFGPMWHYVEAGRYGAQLERCYELFGRDRVFVTTSDRLRHEPDVVWKELLGFLDVEHVPVPDDIESNTSGAPRRPALQRLLYPPDRVRRAAAAMAPWARSAVRALRERNLARAPELPPDTEAALREVFADDVAATARLTGLDLSSWGY